MSTEQPRLSVPEREGALQPFCRLAHPGGENAFVVAVGGPDLCAAVLRAHVRHGSAGGAATLR